MSLAVTRSEYLEKQILYHWITKLGSMIQPNLISQYKLLQAKSKFGVIYSNSPTHTKPPFLYSLYLDTPRPKNSLRHLPLLQGIGKPGLALNVKRPFQVLEINSVRKATILHVADLGSILSTLYGPPSTARSAEPERNNP